VRGAQEKVWIQPYLQGLVRDHSEVFEQHLHHLSVVELDRDARMVVDVEFLSFLPRYRIGCVELESLLPQEHDVLDLRGRRLQHALDDVGLISGDRLAFVRGLLVIVVHDLHLGLEFSSRVLDSHIVSCQLDHDDAHDLCERVE